MALGTDVAQLQEIRGLIADSNLGLERLEKLESEIAKAKGAVDGLGARLESHEAVLREAQTMPQPDLFAQSEARLDELVAGLRELLDRPAPSANLERLLSEKEGHIAALEAARAELEERLESAPKVDEELSYGLRVELARREAKVAELEGVRAELETSLDRLRLTTETYELEFRERELNAALVTGEDEDPRVPELRDELARREEHIATLQADLARLEGAVRSLEITIEVQDQELREVGLGVAEGEPAADLHASFTRERERASALESAIEELRADLTRRESELRAAIDERDALDALRGQMDDGRERLEELNRKNTELERSVAELREALAARGEEAPAEGDLMEELTRHRERVAALEERAIVLESNLRDGERERIELETRHMQDMIQMADQGRDRIVDLEEKLRAREEAIRLLEEQQLHADVTGFEADPGMAQTGAGAEQGLGLADLMDPGLEALEAFEPRLETREGAESAPEAELDALHEDEVE